MAQNPETEVRVLGQGDWHQPRGGAQGQTEGPEAWEMGSEEKKSIAWGVGRWKGFFIWASCFPQTPQGQLVSHCLLGSLGSFSERSAWFLSLLVYVAAPFTFSQWLRQRRGCWVSLATRECGVARQKTSKWHTGLLGASASAGSTGWFQSLENMTWLTPAKVDRQFFSLSRNPCCAEL